MRVMTKRLLSFLLAVIMISCVIPFTALAGTLDNTEEENGKILAELEEVTGSGETAEKYYEILEEYGLLDDDGNLLQNKTITTGGRTYTLLQLRSLLSKDFDEDQTAWVDGSPITLGNLKTILDIEDYISYIRENYVLPDEWSEEQKDSFAGLVEDLYRGEIDLTVQRDESLTGSYSGVNHGAVVTFTTNEIQGTSGSVTAQLSGAAEGQSVTFEYAFVSVTAAAAGTTTGTAVLTAGSDGCAECVLNFGTAGLTKKDLYTEADLLLCLQAWNITNALFANGRTAATHVISMSPTVTDGPDSFGFRTRYTVTPSSYSGMIYDSPLQWIHTISAYGNLALQKGWLTYAKISNCGSLGGLTSADYAYMYKNFKLTVKFECGQNDGGITVASLNLANVRVDDDGNFSSLAYFGEDGNKTGAALTGSLEDRTDDNMKLSFSGSTPSDAIPIWVSFLDDAAPTAAASVPASTFSAGQYVPVTVKFSEPVKISTVSAVINGESMNPAETAADETALAETLTFMYPADSLPKDGTLTVSSVTAEDPEGHGLVWSEQVIEGINVRQRDKIESFTGSEGTLDETDPSSPVLNVSLTVSTDTDLARWLADDLDSDGVSQSLTAAVSEAEKAPFRLVTSNMAGGTITASIPLKREYEDRSCTIELYDGDRLIVQYLESFTLDGIKFITEDSVSTAVVVKNSDGGFYICEDPENPVIYVQDSPVISARFELDATDYTYGDTSSVTCYNGDSPLDSGAMFAWKSSDPDIAVIDSSGVITPTGKSGTVHFILHAFNDGSAQKKVAVETETLTFEAGLTPFVVMPAAGLTSVSGSSLPVYWSSNIPDKDESTVFTLTVKRGGETVYTAKTSGCSETVPGSVLSYDYGDAGANIYSILVSTSYSGNTYSAEGSLVITPAPARVSLSVPESCYMTDSVKSMDISWLVSGLDAADAVGGGLFKLMVTRNSDTVLEITDPGTGNGGNYGGTREIAITDVSASADDPLSYRDVYTVSLQARNGTDSTWSCDSYVFYVYDSGALKLLINGNEAGDEETITNIPEISAMSQDEILALKRVITLDSTLGINYDDYAWTDISDRMSWSSSDGAVAEIRTGSGISGENIEDSGYTSFLPVTEFDLKGITDGRTDISVTHILSGMTAGTSVTVETLENRLYLFSFSPAVTTTITYTNGDGKACTAVSDADGRAAVYEETGITGSLYFSSSYDGNSYTGSMSSGSLASGEGRTAGSSLYPCNNFTLRRTAYAYMYLKGADGKPYTGRVILRAGVYLNGTYLPYALFGTGEDTTACRRGDSDITVSPDLTGKVSVIMDMSQWGLESGIPSWNDEIKYVFEITPADGDEYYPAVVTVDAGRTGYDIVTSGDAIVSMRKNSSNDSDVFICSQQAALSDSEGSVSGTIDLLDSSACTGISDIISRCTLTFGIMWKEKPAGLTIDVSLDTADGGSLGSITGYEVTDSYPFTRGGMTVISFDIDDAAASKAGVGADPVSLKLRWSQSDGKKISRGLSFTFADSTGQAEEISELADDSAADVVSALVMPDTDFGYDSGDSFVNAILSLISSKNYIDVGKDDFGIQIIGTKDPHVFYLLMSIGAGTMKSDNVTGTYALDNNESAKTKFKKTPDWREVKLLFSWNTTDYANSVANEFINAANGEVIVKPVWKVSGYMQLRLTYDNGWNAEVENGGISGGIGVKGSKYFNTWVGPIPVTFEVAAGGSVELGFDAITMRYYLETGDMAKDEEYLTQLRFYLYGYVFGGLGIDYSVVALKIGAFGQLSLDITAKWLNREYFYDETCGVCYYDGDSIENTDGTLDGENIKIDGQIGILFKAKLLFLTYETALCSLPFNMLDVKCNDWQDVGSIWAASLEKSKTYINSQLKSGAASLQNIDGQTYASIDFMPVTEDFSYLDSGIRSWNADTLSSDAGDGSGFTVMQSNAYPFSTPELSDDGEIMVYLSDSDGETGSVQAAYALKGSEGYTDKGLIAEDGRDDAGCCVAGTGSFAVAAWYSLGEGTEKDAGSIITPEEQMIMLEGSEVSAAIYKDGKWTAAALTDNSGADIAPVVAVSGDRAIVAWRSVATSHVNGDISDFDLKDEIHFRIYENGSWSGEQTLYNGTGGNVKGLDAAMLSDGTAAVIYVLDRDADSSTSDDREIQWTVIGTDGTVKRTVQATSDETADENPCITTAEISGREYFVAAWNSLQNGTHDVRLADFDGDGIMTLNLPQTVSSASDDSSPAIGSNFRFVKGAEEIDDLAIVWSETAEDPDDDSAAGDRLMAVRLYTGENGIAGVSMPQILAGTDGYTSIEAIDAYTEDGTILAVSLCTAYDENRLVPYSGKTADGETVELYVADSSSFMATASGKLTNSISVENIAYDNDELVCGNDMLTEFTVKNTGADTITKIEITIGRDVTVINSADLCSGRTGTYYAEYSVPADTLRDEAYTVKSYTKGGTVCAAGTIEFGKCSLRIISAATVQEGDGQRTIDVKLCETSAFNLENSGGRVVIRFCSDAAGEKVLRSMTVSDASTLRMIEEGGYCLRSVFDMSQFADSETGELPAGGADIYIFVDALDSSGKSINLGGESLGIVTLYSLAEKTGSAISIDSFLATGESRSVATVSVRNNYLSGVQSGNLMVSLLDENGNTVELKQSYDPDAADKGLKTLKGEETAVYEFEFDCTGSEIMVNFESFEPVKEESEDDSAGLKLFEITNIPDFSIDSFSRSSGDTFWAETGITRAEQISVVLMPKSVNSKVTCMGRTVEGEIDLDLVPGINTFTFAVTSGSGNVTTEYVLKINNKGIYSVTVSRPAEGGTAAASAMKAVAGETVTITLTPYEGYMAKNAVVTDAEGNKVLLTLTDENTWSFTMPESDVWVESEFIGKFILIPEKNPDSPSVYGTLQEAVDNAESTDTIIANVSGEALAMGDKTFRVMQNNGAVAKISASRGYTIVKVSKSAEKGTLYRVSPREKIEIILDGIGRDSEEENPETGAPAAFYRQR